MGVSRVVKIIKKLGIVKFSFYVFLIVNALIVIIGMLGMCYPFLLSKREFNNNFLFYNLHLVADSKNTLMDYFNSIQYGKFPYSNGVIYPPFINMIFAMLRKMIPTELSVGDAFALRFSKEGLESIVVFFVISVLVYCIALKGLKGFTLGEKIFIGIGLCFTIPTVYCFERGNCIFLCVSCTMIFVNWYKSPNKIERLLAIIAIAVASGIKLYPAIFGLLLVREHMWKETWITIFIGLIVVFLPFFYFAPNNRSICLWASNIINCSNDFQNESLGLGFRLDITNMMKFFEELLNKKLTFLTQIILLFIVVFDLSLVLFDKKMSEWETVTLLTLLIIWVPGFSWTYTMMFIYVPLVLFLNEKNKKLNYFFVFVFIGACSFIPISNQYSLFFKFNDGVKYPIGITTFIENLSLLLLGFGILTKLIVSFKNECFSKISSCKIK